MPIRKWQKSLKATTTDKKMCNKILVTVVWLCVIKINRGFYHLALQIPQVTKTKFLCTIEQTSDEDKENINWGIISRSNNKFFNLTSIIRSMENYKLDLAIERVKRTSEAKNKWLPRLYNENCLIVIVLTDNQRFQKLLHSIVLTIPKFKWAQCFL